MMTIGTSTSNMFNNDEKTTTATMLIHSNDTVQKKNSSNDADNNTDDPYIYMNGLGNEVETECVVGALPQHRNNPRLVPYGLFCEQLSGTAFTVSPRCYNHRTWTYRIEPSVSGREYICDGNNAEIPKPVVYFGQCNPTDCTPTIEPIRWDVPPLKIFENQTNGKSDSDINAGYNFRTGMILMCTAGDVAIKNGINIYMYTNVTQSMSTGISNEHLCNTDGDFLIVPQEGSLYILTELGCLYIQPTEICIIPRGITFQVVLSLNNDDNKNEQQIARRGYVLEVSSIGNGLQLPELGPIGSNGLANARDFQIPVAWCAASTPDAYLGNHIIYNKMSNQLHTCTLNHTPYNVVAWHGNYYPFKYNLNYFCCINSVSYDHVDPSIYTVLTCPSYILSGVALCDFVIFPPRMIATDTNTFRPPWFHKNTMSEYMGLIYGTYDAKVSSLSVDDTAVGNNDNMDHDTGTATKVQSKKKSIGFVPGGASLHNCMTPHGPDEISYTKAIADPCDIPKKLDNGMAFMFETYLPIRVSPIALSTTNNWRDIHYNDCWQEKQHGSVRASAGLSHCNFTGWHLLKKQQNSR
jgi:homogentisate 1,2-dioxygenase